MRLLFQRRVLWISQAQIRHRRRMQREVRRLGQFCPVSSSDARHSSLAVVCACDASSAASPRWAINSSVHGWRSSVIRHSLRRWRSSSTLSQIADNSRLAQSLSRTCGNTGSTRRLPVATRSASDCRLAGTRHSPRSGCPRRAGFTVHQRLLGVLDGARVAVERRRQLRSRRRRQPLQRREPVGQAEQRVRRQRRHRQQHVGEVVVLIAAAGDHPQASGCRPRHRLPQQLPQIAWRRLALPPGASTGLARPACGRWPPLGRSAAIQGCRGSAPCPAGCSAAFADRSRSAAAAPARGQRRPRPSPRLPGSTARRTPRAGGPGP